MKQLFFMAVMLMASVLTLKAQYGGGYGGGGYGRQRMPMNEPTQQQQGPQKIPTPEEMADRETKQLTLALELAPEQVVKVKAMLLNYTRQKMDLMKEYQQTKDQEGIENKLKGIKLAQDSELKEILTPEQQILLKKGGKKIKKGDKKDRKKEEEN